ncbi:hypothetical protein R70723_28610 [Paenibacillus sp. FSL R7-0273]|uniref:hypothetical protein n=1 Tax=Paenibacillus sp. FSL R7-0273 TaxID=1536772 RepID=UPI0004F702A7|nr:hypothetical protein [Paenibacillus sp. FSL R7-0273]AIQ49402.1 hypothetical protein R70723_28610 [Paenibacillus sp. FSL R7-0273]OMF83970.1 hypothetical protein BK144_31035 [Paenibacillus sp. FSL R7-0273]
MLKYSQEFYDRLESLENYAVGQIEKQAETIHLDSDKAQAFQKAKSQQEVYVEMKKMLTQLRLDYLQCH